MGSFANVITTSPVLEYLTFVDLCALFCCGDALIQNILTHKPLSLSVDVAVTDMGLKVIDRFQRVHSLYLNKGFVNFPCVPHDVSRLDNLTTLNITSPMESSLNRDELQQIFKWAPNLKTLHIPLLQEFLLSVEIAKLPDSVIDLQIDNCAEQDQRKGTVLPCLESPSFDRRPDSVKHTAAYKRQLWLQGLRKLGWLPRVDYVEVFHILWLIREPFHFKNLLRLSLMDTSDFNVTHRPQHVFLFNGNKYDDSRAVDITLGSKVPSLTDLSIYITGNIDDFVVSLPPNLTSLQFKHCPADPNCTVHDTVVTLRERPVYNFLYSALPQTLVTLKFQSSSKDACVLKIDIPLAPYFEHLHGKWISCGKRGSINNLPAFMGYTKQSSSMLSPQLLPPNLKCFTQIEALLLASDDAFEFLRNLPPAFDRSKKIGIVFDMVQYVFKVLTKEQPGITSPLSEDQIDVWKQALKSVDFFVQGCTPAFFDLGIQAMFAHCKRAVAASHSINGLTSEQGLDCCALPLYNKLRAIFHPNESLALCAV